jgi:hypothetical protein
MLGTRDADRKRALDVVQELQARPALLAALERWLRPAQSSSGSPATLLAPHDAWLSRMLGGELAELEATLVDLRRPALFASIAGPALAALAARVERRQVTGVLFEQGSAGDAMFIVASGGLVARRTNSPERTIAVGDVLGELSVLTHATRAATVTATTPGTELLVIERAAFSAVAQRAPELILGLSATLAGWLAPSRPDVL